MFENHLSGPIGDDRAPKKYRESAVRFCPAGIAQGFLIRRLARLAVEHPGLDIDLAADVRSVSLERRETDIALRLARPEDGDVMASQVATLDFGFYGSEACRARLARGIDPVFVGFGSIGDDRSAVRPHTVLRTFEVPVAAISLPR